MRASCPTRLAVVGIALLGLTPTKGGAELTPAASRDDADIFLSGALVGASGEDTVYSWDFKLTYPKASKLLGVTRNSQWDRWRVCSPMVEFIANKGTDANPDRVNVSAQIGFLWDTRKEAPSALTSIHWLTRAGGEADRTLDTRDVIIATLGRAIFRTFKGGGNKKFAVTPEVEAGVEVGENYQNVLSKDGSGSVLRTYGALRYRQELGSSKWVFSASYQYRALLRDEVFGEEMGGEIVRRLTSKPRDFVDATVDFSPTEYLSIRPGYKRGSLPPAFTFVDSEFSLSLVFSAAVRPPEGQ